MGIFDFFKSIDELKENYPNGNLFRQFYFKKDYGLHGKFYIYYENGSKGLESNYIDGSCEGNFTTWYKNGQKSSEGKVIRNDFIGKLCTWYPNGKLQSEVKFQFNQQDYMNNMNPHDLDYGINGSKLPISTYFTIKNNIVLHIEKSRDRGIFINEEGHNEDLSVQDIQKRISENCLKNHDSVYSIYNLEIYSKPL